MRVGFYLKRMMLAVDLNDALCGMIRSVEVGEVGTNRMLTPELAASELAVGEQAPNKTFGVTRFSLSSCSLVWEFMTHLTPALSPHEDVGGEGHD